MGKKRRGIEGERNDTGKKRRNRKEWEETKKKKKKREYVRGKERKITGSGRVG